jgi:hypothetical protein
LHAVDHVLLAKKLESYLTLESLENNNIALKKKKYLRNQELSFFVSSFADYRE